MRLLSYRWSLLLTVMITVACGQHSSPHGKNPDINPPHPSPDGNTPQTDQPELPKYRSLTEAFADVGEIMRSDNTANTLARLRSIAAPTDQYHADLVTLLQSVTGTDMAHVKMLLQACYFQFATYEQMQAEWKALHNTAKNGADIDSAKERELSRNIRLARSLDGYLSSIADIGFSKIGGFNWDETIETLKLVYPTGTTRAAFQKALDAFGSISNDQKRTFMLLASDKNEANIAAGLAIDLFINTTDKSPAALRGFVEQLKWHARDQTLLDGLNHFESLTHEDVVAFVKLTYAKGGEVAVKAYRKSNQKSHLNVLAIAKILGDHGREYFVNDAIETYEAVTTSEVIDLCKVASGICNRLTQKTASKWADPSAHNAADVATLVSYSDKDNWLTSVLGYFKTVTTDDVLIIEAASYLKQYEFAANLLAKISDFSVPNAIRICATFSYSQKDNWLFLVEPKIATLKTSELIQLIGAAYLKQLAFANKVFSKLSDVNAANAAAVADTFSYSSKDEWLTKAAPAITSLTAAELTSLLKTAYLKQLLIAKILIDRVTDLTPMNTARVADNIFEYGSKDEWLAAASVKWNALLTADLDSVIKAGYLKQLQLALTLLPHVRDLTVANAIAVSKDFSYSSIDTFLLSALELVTDLNATNLDDMATASYQKQSEIKAKGRKRLGT